MQERSDLENETCQRVILNRYSKVIWIFLMPVESARVEEYQCMYSRCGKIWDLLWEIVISISDEDTRDELIIRLMLCICKILFAQSIFGNLDGTFIDLLSYVDSSVRQI